MAARLVGAVAIVILAGMLFSVAYRVFDRGFDSVTTSEYAVPDTAYASVRDSTAERPPRSKPARATRPNPPRPRRNHRSEPVPQAPANLP